MIVINLELSNFLKPFTDGFKNVSDEIRYLFSIGLEEYLKAQSDKYYFVNTFLHRADKVIFFDIFYPINISYKNVKYSFESPRDLFKKYPYITIIGSAGSGKSTLTKALYLNAIKERYKIPILIELRNLNECEVGIENFILSRIVDNDLEPSLKIAKKALKEGHFLFILDGYDEIFSNKKQKFIDDIGKFVDKYLKNKYVITSRPGSGIEGYDRFHNFDVCSLSETDVVKFIVKMVDNEERQQRILNLVSEQKGNYSEYLKNPLLLSMFILAFESHPEIPRRKSAFYKNVFDTLYSKHDGITKNSYPREKRTKLQREDFERILALFSYLSLYDGEIQFTKEYFEEQIIKIKAAYGYSFDTNDLLFDFETSISIFVREGFEYKLPHKTMLEFFATEFLSRLATEKKQAAYNNLFSKILRKGNDNAHTLYTLCEEQDKLNFYEYYIIPSVEEMLKTLNGLSDIARFVKYLNLRGAYLIYDNAKPIDKRIMSIIIFSMRGNPILNFIKIKPFSQLFSKRSKARMIADANSFYEQNPLKTKNETAVNSLTLINIDNKVAAVFYNEILNRSVKKSISEISEILDGLKRDIQKETNQINTILGI